MLFKSHCGSGLRTNTYPYYLLFRLWFCTSTSFLPWLCPLMLCWLLGDKISNLFTEIILNVILCFWYNSIRCSLQYSTNTIKRLTNLVIFDVTALVCFFYFNMFLNQNLKLKTDRATLNQKVHLFILCMNNISLMNTTHLLFYHK